MKTRVMTLLLTIKNNKILLAEKKRGFGCGLFNGAGGKVQDGETIEEAMIRETQEEFCITPTKYEKVAINNFEIIYKGEWTILEGHIYIATEYTGEPSESEEMKPEWFDIDKIPYDKMWPDDILWFPRVLKGEKIKSFFKFDKDDNIISYNIETADAL